MHRVVLFLTTASLAVTSFGAFASPSGAQTGDLAAFCATRLEPGTYVYACFLPVAGEETGAPHFTEGMYGTFTVS